MKLRFNHYMLIRKELHVINLVGQAGGCRFSPVP
jgi:hypothetical protein